MNTRMYYFTCGVCFRIPTSEFKALPKIRPSTRSWTFGLFIQRVQLTAQTKENEISHLHEIINNSNYNTNSFLAQLESSCQYVITDCLSHKINKPFTVNKPIS